MDISFVIPNFNGERLLEKNLPKVLAIAAAYKGGSSEVIVTDDSSKDNSITVLNSLVKTNKTSVSLVILRNNSGKNKGFSTNVNKGIREAKGEIVILLNTDVVPKENFLDPLLSHFSSENVFAVGCMDESVENNKIVLRGRGIGKWQRGFLVHSAGNIADSTSTLWVSCGSGAFRKSIWEKIGGLNELYNPFYWEDIDLSYKAQKAGFGVFFEKGSIVRHEHEIGSIKKNYSLFTVKKTAYRNQFFFTWLNATDTMLLIQHVAFLPYFLIKMTFAGEYAFIIGFISALLLLPKVLVARRRVQKIVTKSDKEIINQFRKEL